MPRHAYFGEARLFWRGTLILAAQTRHAYFGEARLFWRGTLISARHAYLGVLPSATPRCQFWMRWYAGKAFGMDYIEGWPT